MKLIKCYKLIDEPTGLSVIALYREQLEPLEHSTSIVEDGYFITKEQIGEAFVRGMFSVVDVVQEPDGLIGIKTILEVKDYLKELGIE